MAFYRITHNKKYRFATLHNYGCTFRCSVCSYKLKSGAKGKPGLAYPAPKGYLSTEQIKEALSGVDLETVYFMGGEPTAAKELPELLEFTKTKLKARTYLGHTNGSNLSIPFLDGANVGLKAWDADIHLNYTGKQKDKIFGNFENAFRAGMDLKANVVYIPSFVDVDQVESVARWLGSLSSDIDFHIMGYIPVPGQPFAAPDSKQINEVVEICRKYLKNVKSSSLTAEQAKNLSARDDRFVVTEIANAG